MENEHEKEIKPEELAHDAHEKKIRKGLKIPKNIYTIAAVVLIVTIILALLISGGLKKKKALQITTKHEPQTSSAFLAAQKKAKSVIKRVAPALPPLSPKITAKIQKISAKLPSYETQYKKPTLAQKAAVSPMVSVVSPQSSAPSPIQSILNQQASLVKLKSKAQTALNSVPAMEKKITEEARITQLAKTNPNQAFLEGMKQKKENFEKVLVSQKPVSGCEVEAGTIIPAVLISRIDSNLPGFIKAETVNDVFSYNGRCLEIPKGSFLIGMYSSQIAANQSRLLVAFKTLELPSGRQINLLGMPGMAGRGTSGFHDLVNTHFWTIFGTSLLLSFISVGSQAYGTATGAVSPSAYGGTSPVTPAGVGEQTLSNTASNLSQNMLARYANIPPTLIIRQGFRFNVFVSKNMILPQN